MKYYDKLIFEISRPGRVGYSLPKSALSNQQSAISIPENLLRETPAELPEVSELDVVRHYTNVSNKNFGVETGFYPLGSCTMKYNPKINEEKRASYIVQLSTVEACSNTVLEALNLNVPLICTPVPCFFELGVVDGVNAHVVPFDMRFDVNKLLTIPKYDFRYDNERRVEQWKQIL